MKKFMQCLQRANFVKKPFCIFFLSEYECVLYVIVLPIMAFSGELMRNLSFLEKELKKRTRPESTSSFEQYSVLKKLIISRNRLYQFCGVPRFLQAMEAESY